MEIESPPWHFILHKDKCIVPEVIRSGILKKGEGTRLIVKFSNPDVINIVAKELDRFVAGQVESFLFLQRLGTILVEDRRKDLAEVRGLKLLPPDRSEDKLLLTTFPGDVKRKYVLYREEADFPTELVSGRWERLGYEIGPLKRQIIVAALVDTSGSHYPEGRLFCFLPTSVSLPVPIFLQVDGHTKVDRERLHDPEQNAWNKHLLSLLPGFLLQALLAWRKHEEIAVKLPAYVPVSEGSDQLSFVFKQLIGLLGNAPWVRTFDEEEEGWVSPDKALMATAYWTIWLTKYPGFRKQVEKILGKKFVHPDWTKDKEIKNKLIFYEVKNMNEVQIATILEKAVLPQEMLKKDENFIDLYKEILNCPSLTSQAAQSKVWQSIKILREPENTELKKHLLQAPIYPFSGGEFGALQDGDQSAKVFWFSGGARRSIGLEESVDFRIIDVQYTYDPKLDADALPEKKTELETIKLRNEVVRKLLSKLGVKELSDENILSDIQLPLLREKRQGGADDSTLRFKVLESIFKAYRAKRNLDESYLKQLAELSGAYFLSVNGALLQLKEMVLPAALRLKPIDRIYGKSELEELGLPAKLFKKANPHEKKERRRKLREDWRQFLIHCGIRNGPDFISRKDVYDNCWRFRDVLEYYYDFWMEEINGNCTMSRTVELIRVELDGVTRHLLQSDHDCHKFLAGELYDAWKKTFINELDFIENPYQLIDVSCPPPGYFLVKYFYRQRRPSLVMDPFWGGIKRELVPLKSIKGLIFNSGEALRTFPHQERYLQKAAELLPLVLEDGKGDAGYHTVYLNSFNVRTPKITDVNSLWDKLGKKDYPEIIKVALEFLDIGISWAGLMLFDKETGCLRPASDFRLGREGSKGVPLIEKQYGKLGRILGEKLGLPEENEVNSFMGLFENMLSARPLVEEFADDLYRLLKHWQSWDTGSRGIIASELRVALGKHEMESPPVVLFNDPQKLALFIEVGILALGLKIEESERYGLVQSVREIGLLLPDEVGKLEVKGEKALDERELKRFDRLLYGYVDSLEDHEKSRLTMEAARCGLGSFENWDKKVLRAESVARVAGLADEVKFFLDLPYLDSRRRQFFVASFDALEIILAHLLSICGFTRFKHAYTDIKEIASRLRDKAPLSEQAAHAVPGRGQLETTSDNVRRNAGLYDDGNATPAVGLGKDIADARNAVSSETNNVIVNDPGKAVGTGVIAISEPCGGRTFYPKDPKDVFMDAVGDSCIVTGGTNVVDVASAIRGGLVDNRPAPAVGMQERDWNSGLDPEQEEELREKIGLRLIESLKEGPDFYERKLKKIAGRSGLPGKEDNMKIIDPNAGDPKAFLLAEYGGKCQVCKTELLLSSGRKWFEVFRIIEPHRTVWWADRPFNILCLCPNCHALSKHGGRDMKSIYHSAKEALLGQIFPIEVSQFKGDFYVVPVSVNGRNQELVVSKRHMSYFVGLFKAEEEVAATNE